MVCAVLALTPSCTSDAWNKLGLSGTAVIYNGDGAKAGLTFTPGKAPVPFGKVEIRDASGAVIGYAEISAEPQVIAEK